MAEALELFGEEEAHKNKVNLEKNVTGTFINLQGRFSI